MWGSRSPLLHLDGPLRGPHGVPDLDGSLPRAILMKIDQANLKRPTSFSEEKQFVHWSVAIVIDLTAL